MRYIAPPIQPPPPAYVDRLWRQVQYLLAKAHPPSRRYPLHQRVWRHLTAGPKGRSADPDLQRVLAIHKDGPHKAELQARLLTGATFEQIATKMDLPAAVVELYHKIFFDVATRLKTTNWIWLYAFRNDSFHMTPLDESMIWRRVGWECPAALELLIADSKQVTSPPEHAVAERIRLLLRVKSMSHRARDYRRLCQTVRDGLVAQTITAPRAAFAEALIYLDQLETETRAELPIRPPRPRAKVRAIKDRTEQVLEPNERKRSCEKGVTQETIQGMGDSGRTEVPVSEPARPDDGESAIPVPGPGLCGGVP